MPAVSHSVLRLRLEAFGEGEDKRQINSVFYHELILQELAENLERDTLMVRLAMGTVLSHLTEGAQVRRGRDCGQAFKLSSKGRRHCQ
jgi:hypothetical protein